MKNSRVFMFSGQGSHYYQMGRVLFEQNTVFRQWMILADKVYQEMTDLSVLDTLYHPAYSKSQQFSRTLLTHPAIFMVEHALGQLLLSQNIIPDAVLGVSLGEFAAAVFAEIMPFETAMQAVITQAQILETCLDGGMLAILDSPTLYNTQDVLRNQSELAAINFSSHFVISGPISSIESSIHYLKHQQISCQKLAVSQAFHSSHIDSAAPLSLSYFKKQHFNQPKIPFISSSSPQQQVSTVSSSHFWDIIRQPIQFMTTIQYLEQENHYDYLDVGPSGTLATFIKYNLTAPSRSKALALMTPMADDLISLEKFYYSI